MKYANNPQVWNTEAEKLGVQVHLGLHKTMPQKMITITTKICPRLFLCHCYKDNDQKQVGEERVDFRLQVTIHHKGKPGQEFKAGTAAYWLSSCFCLSSFLIELRTTCLRQGALPTVCWALLHQLATKKMPHRHVHRPV